VPAFDPYALLGTLERHRLAYIIVGGFARVIQGTEELTRGVDIVPSLRAENLRRLERALTDLGARHGGGTAPLTTEEMLVLEPILVLETAGGELKVVREPAGTRGYDDLRRQATREHLGRGLRPVVASTADLARMLAALGRERDMPILYQLRRLMELDRGHGLEL
jgi:hypothetical protein